MSHKTVKQSKGGATKCRSALALTVKKGCGRGAAGCGGKAACRQCAIQRMVSIPIFCTRIPIVS